MIDHRTPLRVYAFASGYPSAYKPYYDAQFAEIIDQGHSLRIFAAHRLDRIHSDLVNAYRLQERTEYLLAHSLAGAARLTPRIAAAGARSPAEVARRIRLSIQERPLKRIVKAGARMAALPAEPPDLCLVHSHETLSLVPWLHRIYPRSPIALYYYGGLPPEAGRIAGDPLRRAFTGVTVVFALTQFAREEAIALGSIPERTRILPLGFRMSSFPAPTARSYLPDGILRILSVGRLSEGKGHLVALRALALLQQESSMPFHYEILGSGPMRDALVTAVRQLGLQGRVSFIGSLGHEDVIARMLAADLLLLPSIPTPAWNETQGAVMQEALLQGCLVVASRTGGVPESVPPFMDDFLVPPGDPQRLANAIRRVHAMDEFVIRELALRGREWVLYRYDNRMLVPRMIQESLAARH